MHNIHLIADRWRRELCQVDNDFYFQGKCIGIRTQYRLWVCRLPAEFTTKGNHVFRPYTELYVLVFFIGHKFKYYSFKNHLYSKFVNVADDKRFLQTDIHLNRIGLYNL